MGLKNRRSSFSQLKTALIFPGSRGKTTEGALVRAYKGSTILSCTTSSGYQVGLLLGAGQPSAVQPSPPVPGMRYLVYFYGNGMCLETCGYEFAQFRQLGYTVLIVIYSNSWRVSIIKLGTNLPLIGLRSLSRRFFSKIVEIIIWRDILAHLFWRNSKMLQ